MQAFIENIFNSPILCSLIAELMRTDRRIYVVGSQDLCGRIAEFMRNDAAINGRGERAFYPLGIPIDKQITGLFPDLYHAPK